MGEIKFLILSVTTLVVVWDVAGSGASPVVKTAHPFHGISQTSLSPVARVSIMVPVGKGVASSSSSAVSTGATMSGFSGSIGPASYVDVVAFEANLHRVPPFAS